MAGSDSGAAWASFGYLLAITLVAFLLTYRLVLAATERRAMPGRASEADVGSGRIVSAAATATTPDAS
jgi:hypothetical protein